MEILDFDTGDSLVNPNNEVDQEVCYLLALPDDPQICPRLAERFGATARKAFLEGGQVIYDEDWSDHVLVHYKVNRESAPGLRFPVAVSLWSSGSSDSNATEEFFVSLKRHGIPLGFDQIRAERMDGRRHQINPFWHHPNCSDPRQLFVTREVEIPGFGRIQPPHRRLFDLSKLG